LIESDLVNNLASPCRLPDTSWIRPGMMAWDHWWSGDVKMDTATLKEYVQLAANMGWPYQLVDWQWYGPYNKPTASITNINPAVGYGRASPLCERQRCPPLALALLVGRGPQRRL
jgi:alpha-glucosidase